MATTPMRRLTAALMTALLALGPSHLFAQDGETPGSDAPGEGPTEELVSPTDAQQDYNDQGVVLIQDGKYKQAIASFRSSLSLGELNITYLNLGRAYYRLDRCLEAREAYDSVKGAPKVKAPSPSEISEILSRFESEYAESCTATIAITCEGEPMVSVGDQPARMCSEVSAWPVVPGDYDVVATYDTGEVSETVTVAGRSAASVSFEEPEVVVENDPTSVEPGAKATADESTPAYVWVVLGTGLALAATAVVWDLVITGGQLADLEDTEGSIDPADIEANFELRDDIDTNQTITFALAGASAAVLTTGVILWALSGGEEPEAADDAGVSAWIGDGSGGFVFSGRF